MIVDYSTSGGESSSEEGSHLLPGPEGHKQHKQTTMSKPKEGTFSNYMYAVVVTLSFNAKMVLAVFECNLIDYRLPELAPRR